MDIFINVAFSGPVPSLKPFLKVLKNKLAWPIPILTFIRKIYFLYILLPYFWQKEKLLTSYITFRGPLNVIGTN